MNRKTIVFCAFLVIVLTAPAFPLMRKLSLKELNGGADLIATGKAVEKECRWGEEGKWIYTYVKVSVDEYIKGEGEKEVIVRHLGGEVGEKGLIVGNMPDFREDEEVLVFLGKARDDLTTLDMRGNAREIRRVCGLAQGKYEVFEDESGRKMVRNNFSDLYVEDAGGMKLIDEKVLSAKAFSEFVSEIKEVLEEEN